MESGTKGTPFIKGDIAEALLLQDRQLSKEVINTLSGAGATVAAALTGAVSAVLRDFFTAQLNRFSAMRDAQWFIWSNSLVTWNSFGDISDKWINPSFTCVDPFGGTCVRIGVTYSNVAVGQGPDFTVKGDCGRLLLRGPLLWMPG